jgi:hypothetical protein
MAVLVHPWTKTAVSDYGTILYFSLPSSQLKMFEVIYFLLDSILSVVSVAQCLFVCVFTFFYPWRSTIEFCMFNLAQLDYVKVNSSKCVCVAYVFFLFLY